MIRLFSSFEAGITVGRGVGATDNIELVDVAGRHGAVGRANVHKSRSGSEV